MTGPGRATVPAFSSVPLKVLRYRLTADDALVWEQLSREFTKAEKRALVLTLFVAGVAYGVAEDWVPAIFAGLPGIVKMLIVVACVFLGQMLWMNVRQHRRARRRFPVPVNMICEAWHDHLSACPVDQPSASQHVVAETIRQVVVDRGRLFIDDLSGLLILPQSAFADEQDMRAFAAAWDEASEKAAP